jgi:hypothetical protein
MRVAQGEIVEVSFNLPQGYLPHPAVVSTLTVIFDKTLFITELTF